MRMREAILESQHFVFQASSYYFVLKTLNMGQPAYDAAQEDAFWDIMSKK